jgi:hypothetical protein
MPITIDGTNGITQAGEFNSDSSFGFKNRIINGAMVIDQRNAGASVTPTANAYTLDRWTAFLTVASKFSVQQNAGSVTPPVGFTNYLGVTSTSAYTVGAAEEFSMVQIIEGYNVADLGWGTANAKTITISFWIRSSLTGTFGGSLGNGAFNRTYPFTYTISVANTWEYKTVTIAGDTSGTWLTTNGIGLYVIFGLGVGSTLSGTAGAWASAGYFSATGATSVVGTNGATFYITGVQLEVGSTATSFDYRPYGTELALCQRYFQTYGYGNGQEAVLGTGMFYTSTELLIVAEFKVIMRAIPTYSCTTVTNGFRYSRAGATTNINTLPYLGSRSTSSAIFGNVSLAVGGTAGYASNAIAELDGAKINFSAEL